MKTKIYVQILLLFTLSISFTITHAQEISVKDLDFLTGTWEVREDNDKKTWWEESTRYGSFVMDSTYIELKCQAISSTGKKRTYTWLIHYNFKIGQFEMVSMFSNWHAIQMDILEWNSEERKLTIRHHPNRGTEDYHERLGALVFNEDFSEYTWTGENKYGDRQEPKIWRYVEIGKKVVSE